MFSHKVRIALAIAMNVANVTLFVAADGKQFVVMLVIGLFCAVLLANQLALRDIRRYVRGEEG